LIETSTLSFISRACWSSGNWDQLWNLRNGRATTSLVTLFTTRPRVCSVMSFHMPSNWVLFV
jgi:hypothetical protein